ncbi:MAG: adenine phosphoribosyltransferase [Deltaproteobacteria bacterium]|nr:adenine phosphoribosyltransferase [Deltaproteobacteria bacterium]
MTYWQSRIVDVPDHPKPGIVFKDITPLLADAVAFADVTRAFADVVRPWAPTQIVGVESRGFIFGAALANALGLGLTLVRKKGKLPRETRRVTYALEYGEDTVEMHADALRRGDRAVVIDDVLATGGTARAVADLVHGTGATLAGMAFLMELAFLPGRTRLPAGVDVHALMTLG